MVLPVLDVLDYRDEFNTTVNCPLLKKKTNVFQV